MQKLWRLWHLFVLSSSSSITMVLLRGGATADQASSEDVRYDHIDFDRGAVEATPSTSTMMATTPV